MNILIIGAGGREHALAWKATQSPLVSRVFVAPGNAGTALENGLENVAIAADDIPALLAFATNSAIALTIVGPEVPLVLGIVDEFQAAGLTIFGPSKAAARLEGSKAFSKDFLQRHNIPTAVYATFTDTATAIDYLQNCDMPIVIKADGLAAGKGVIIAADLPQATQAVESMLAGNRFGAAGNKIVVEEFLRGEEASFIVMADGKHILPLATSQDHKARDNGDLGPNTGGMGAYSPAPVVTPEIHARVMDTIIKPTIDGLSRDGTPYSGFLYAGLMIDEHGEPKVLEYNCRFGDPETQPIMMRLQSDLIKLCIAAVDQSLHLVSAQWDPRIALGVVMAAGGYPDSYASGQIIQGLKDTSNDMDNKTFHAGTALEGENIVTAGGRVLCNVALGNNITEAQSKAYALTEKIHWQDAYYRTDIGFKAVEFDAKHSSDTGNKV
ncbi:MAG: phosphoribosylamine--glycine ligase [Thiohalomonadales bacterium]